MYCFVSVFKTRRSKYNYILIQFQQRNQSQSILKQLDLMFNAFFRQLFTNIMIDPFIIWYFFILQSQYILIIFIFAIILKLFVYFSENLSFSIFSSLWTNPDLFLISHFFAYLHPVDTTSDHIMHSVSISILLTPYMVISII